MSAKPRFAARRTLRPLSTAISPTSVALPGPSARTFPMRLWAAGSSGSTYTREVARRRGRRQHVVAEAPDDRLRAAALKHGAAVC